MARSSKDGTTETKQRNYRTVEERLAEIDQKIKFHEDAIRTLEEKRKKVRMPGQSSRTLAKKISELGLTLEDILEAKRLKEEAETTEE